MIRWEDFDFIWSNPNNKYSSFGNGVPVQGVAPEFPPWLARPVKLGGKSRPEVSKAFTGNGYKTE